MWMKAVLEQDGYCQKQKLQYVFLSCFVKDFARCGSCRKRNIEDMLIEIVVS